MHKIYAEHWPLKEFPPVSSSSKRRQERFGDEKHKKQVVYECPSVNASLWMPAGPEDVTM